MRLLRRVGVLLALLGLTTIVVLAQQPYPSSGGSFLPNQDTVVAGQWTFTGANPLRLWPSATSTANLVITASPTSTRTWTLPDATDTAVGKATTDTLTNKTLTAPVLSGSVTGTYTLAGTPTFTSPTITTPVIATITNTGTLTLPSATGGVSVVLYCGSTGTGNQTCAPATAAATTKTYVGHSTLSSNAAVITFPTAFASTTYDCVANDITTRANPVQMLSTSSTTATITNTTGASDVINWSCTGQ